MSMYACVVLLAVGVAMASALTVHPIPKCWFCLPEPICEPCICRVQARPGDAAHNKIFAPWFNSVFDKLILKKCPPPTFKKKFYYPPGVAKCECKPDKVPQQKCRSEIWKLQHQQDPYKQVHMR